MTKKYIFLLLFLLILISACTSKKKQEQLLIEQANRAAEVEMKNLILDSNLLDDDFEVRSIRWDNNKIFGSVALRFPEAIESYDNYEFIYVESPFKDKSINCYSKFSGTNVEEDLIDLDGTSSLYAGLTSVQIYSGENNLDPLEKYNFEVCCSGKWAKNYHLTYSCNKYTIYPNEES